MLFGLAAEMAVMSFILGKTYMQLKGMHRPVSSQKAQNIYRIAFKRFPRYFPKWSSGFVSLSTFLPIYLCRYFNAISCLVADLVKVLVRRAPTIAFTSTTGPDADI